MNLFISISFCFFLNFFQIKIKCSQPSLYELLGGNFKLFIILTYNHISDNLNLKKILKMFVVVITMIFLNKIEIMIEIEICLYTVKWPNSDTFFY